MIKVLFVCHGNICRSPMAEFVMMDMVKKAGLERQITVASAATSSEEYGSPVHRGTREKLRSVGISCAGKTARTMTRRDYDEYDLLIGMERYNLRNMQRICGGDPEGKMHLLLEYAGRSGDIADPYYSGDFDATYRDVVEGCSALLEAIRHGDI